MCRGCLRSHLHLLQICAILSLPPLPLPLFWARQCRPAPVRASGRRAGLINRLIPAGAEQSDSQPAKTSDTLASLASWHPRFNVTVIPPRAGPLGKPDTYLTVRFKFHRRRVSHVLASFHVPA